MSVGIQSGSSIGKFLEIHMPYRKHILYTQTVFNLVWKYFYYCDKCKLNKKLLSICNVYTEIIDTFKLVW